MTSGAGSWSNRCTTLLDARLEEQQERSVSSVNFLQTHPATLP